MKKAWKGILGLLMAMTFTVSAGRMVYAETVDENHEVPDGVTVNGMELGGLTVKAAEDKLQQYMSDRHKGQFDQALQRAVRCEE